MRQGSKKPLPITYSQALSICRHSQTQDLNPESLLKAVRIFLQIRSRVGEFTSIIIDEQGAHIIGLFLWHLINFARDERQVPRLPGRLYALGRLGIDPSKEREFKELVKSDPAPFERALFITEFAQSNNTLKGLDNVLASLNCDPPTMIVMHVDDVGGPEMFEYIPPEDIDGELIIGSYASKRDETRDSYGSDSVRSIVGSVKIPGSIFREALPKEEREENFEQIREDAREMAREVWNLIKNHERDFK